MAISVHILKQRGLVYVRYGGRIEVSETMAAFAEHLKHPDFRPGMKQLVDLADVTGWDNDFVGLMEMQAEKAQHLMDPRRELIFVYYAPTPVTRNLAQTIIRSWEGIDGAIVRVQETEADALSILGQPETSFAELLDHAR